MKRSPILLALMLTTAVTASITAVQLRMAAASDGDPAQVDAGRQLYLVGCVSCHGVDGEGTDNGPKLVGVGAASADFYLSTGRMPAADPPNIQPSRKEPAYSPDEIAALTAFVASLGPGPPIPEVNTDDADVANGGVLYRANCASCHQAAGIGGALSYGRSAPSLHDATAVQVVEAMRTGPGQMPVFDENALASSDANDIAAYVEYLRSPDDRGGASLGHSGPVGEGFVALLVGLGGVVLVSVWIVGRRHA
jgi:ubiquinol-cytochrome c reductase cytochrome c subunit